MTLSIYTPPSAIVCVLVLTLGRSGAISGAPPTSAGTVVHRSSDAPRPTSHRLARPSLARNARMSLDSRHCPLPILEDRLLFILVYLKTYALQVVQGRLCGMSQSKANQ